jgi:hypothetical protein
MSEKTKDILLIPDDLIDLYNLYIKSLIPDLNNNQIKFIIDEWNNYKVIYPRSKNHFFNTIILDLLKIY